MSYQPDGCSASAVQLSRESEGEEMDEVPDAKHGENGDWRLDLEPAYEIGYSRILLRRIPGTQEEATTPLPTLPIHAQISVLEAYLYLGGADIRGI